MVSRIAVLHWLYCIVSSSSVLVVWIVSIFWIPFSLYFFSSLETTCVVVDHVTTRLLTSVIVCFIILGISYLFGNFFLRSSLDSYGPLHLAHLCPCSNVWNMFYSPTDVHGLHCHWYFSYRYFLLLMVLVIVVTFIAVFFQRFFISCLFYYVFWDPFEISVTLLPGCLYGRVFCFCCNSLVVSLDRIDVLKLSIVLVILLNYYSFILHCLYWC